MICEKCGKYFPIHLVIEGKSRNLGSRKYCLECSPFGKHNTRKKDDIEYKCYKCGDTNPQNFPLGRYSECKKCRNKYNKVANRNNKVKGIAYLGGRCVCCGFDMGISAFDFHHINPENKNISFARHLYWSWDRLKKELDSCLLLCSNCHRMLHNGEISYKDFKFMPEDKLYLML